MMETIGLRISGGPPGLVRVQTQSRLADGDIVRYLERRDGAGRATVIPLDRQHNGPLFESDSLSVSVQAYKDRVEVVIGVK